MTRRTKHRIAQSKRAHAGSLAIVDQPQVARTCIPRAFRLKMSCCLSLVLRLFCFCYVLFSFRLHVFIEAAALRSIVVQYTCAPTATGSCLTNVCVLFCFCYFLPCFFRDAPFPEYFYTIAVFSRTESTYVFAFQVVSTL